MEESLIKKPATEQVIVKPLNIKENKEIPQKIIKVSQVLNKVSIANFVLISTVIALILILYTKQIQNKKLIEIVNQKINSSTDQLSTEILYLHNNISLDNIRGRKIREIEKIIGTANKLLTVTQINSFATLIVDNSEKYKSFDHVFFAALASKESSFNPVAVSDSLARGMFQLTSETAMEACSYLGWKYYDGIEYIPEKNITMAACYLASRIALYKGNKDLALASWNGGGNNAMRFYYAQLKEQGVYLDSCKLISISNLWDETKNFVPAVNSIDKKFRALISN